MTRLFCFFDASCEVPSYRGLKSPFREFGFRSEVEESRKQGWGRIDGMRRSTPISASAKLALIDAL